MNPELAELLAQSRHAVALTGAGVSTLSGLPDFRGRNGLYQNPANMRIFDIDEFHKDPSFYYRSCASMLYGDLDPGASLVHQSLARLEAEGVLKGIITQNIDLLHQKAGSQVVVEIHGSPLHHHCLSCGDVFDYQTMKDRIQAGDIPPRCHCGGSIKPDITFFGENLPTRAWDQAMKLAASADLFLVLGTSLTVHPAASLPSVAKSVGARLVIINDQPTPLDHLADLCLPDLEAAFS